MTSGTRPAGLSCRAIAPAIAAAPAAQIAADGDPEATATATTASTPSMLRDTEPTSGVVSCRALITRPPVVTRPF